MQFEASADEAEDSLDRRRLGSSRMRSGARQLVIVEEVAMEGIAGGGGGAIEFGDEEEWV